MEEAPGVGVKREEAIIGVLTNDALTSQGNKYLNNGFGYDVDMLAWLGGVVIPTFDYVFNDYN